MKQPVAVGESANFYLTSALDSQLLQACRAHDEQAWQALLDKYEGMVYSVPLGYGLPHAEAAEVAQIVFTALIQSLDTLCDSSNLVGWLTLVARRYAWRSLRNLSGSDLSDEMLTAHLRNRSNQSELTSPALPPMVHDTLMRRFIDYTHDRQQLGLFQRQRAVLTFDTLHQVAPAGLRGSNDEATRQYVYAIDLMDVSLNVQPNWLGTHLDLMGQILPNSENFADDAFVVQLLQHEQEVAITQADTVGGFWFGALEPGTYGLLLSTDEIELELPNFAVEL
jgi:DNA-directed RNA polymerase specialized sigma24 family protein